MMARRAAQVTAVAAAAGAAYALFVQAVIHDLAPGLTAKTFAQDAKAFAVPGLFAMLASALMALLATGLWLASRRADRWPALTASVALAADVFAYFILLSDFG